MSCGKLATIWRCGAGSVWMTSSGIFAYLRGISGGIFGTRRGTVTFAGMTRRAARWNGVGCGELSSLRNGNSSTYHYHVGDMEERKKPKTRIPMPPPQKPHSTKNGRKNGYARRENGRIAKEEEEMMPAEDDSDDEDAPCDLNSARVVLF